MKLTMRTPAVTEIYQQKMLYQQHLRKLQKIRQVRKNQLTFDSTRIAKHDEIRHSKSRSFAHKYNEQHNQITQSNIKLLNKLEKVRPFTRYTSFSEHERDDRQQFTMTPFKKRRIEQTQKQNSRIYMKMKSVSSSLSRDKLMKDFNKSQQIRTRIARYATQNNKVCLKSEKYINIQKNNLASHYNAHDILNNRVDNPTKQMKLKQKQQNNKSGQRSQKQLSHRVFATQPQKCQNLRGKRKIHF